MSRRTREELIDDLDGTSQADETIEFGMDGICYEIDLSGTHAAAMREQMAVYVRAGRRSTRRRRRRDAVDPAQVRRWARERGITIGRRGRVPAKVIAQFHAEAHRLPGNGSTPQ